MNNFLKNLGILLIVLGTAVLLSKLCATGLIITGLTV